MTDDQTRPFLVTAIVEDLLVQVRERAVADVVQKGRRDGDQTRALHGRALPGNLTGGQERVENALRHEGDADRVREARVLGPVKGQIQRAELADAAQPLELPRVDQVEDEPFPLLVEVDGTVDRIAQVFVGHDRFPSRRTEDRAPPGRQDTPAPKAAMKDFYSDRRGPRGTR